MYILLGIVLGIFFVFMPIFYAIFGIEVALIITILFSYDEELKFSNSKGFLLQTI